MKLAQIFGRNVRTARLERGWSQEHLAFEAKIRRSYLSDIEGGKRNPSLDTVESLARALDMDVAALLRNTNS